TRLERGATGHGDDVGFNRGHVRTPQRDRRHTHTVFSGDLFDHRTHEGLREPVRPLVPTGRGLQHAPPAERIIGGAAEDYGRSRAERYPKSGSAQPYLEPGVVPARSFRGLPESDPSVPGVLRTGVHVHVGLPRLLTGEDVPPTAS